MQGTRHHWRPIAGLPEDLINYRDPELESLFQSWSKQRESLSQRQALARFNRELAREWSIETGIIEGVYKLDRGVTQTLIQKGIDARFIPHDATDRDPELVARTIQAHKDVLDGLFAFVKSERQLSTGYIREIHAALLRYQKMVTVFDQFGNSFETELLKGVYKTHPNNPQREDGSIHEYCPPDHVTAEMDSLISIHSDQRDRGVASYVEAAWLHDAFTQIHPFQDGNGRVARTIASLILIRAGLFPLVVTRDERTNYIETLEAADVGKLGPLIDFISASQMRPLRIAVKLAPGGSPATK